MIRIGLLQEIVRNKIMIDALILVGVYLIGAVVLFGGGYYFNFFDSSPTTSIVNSRPISNRKKICKK